MAQKLKSKPNDKYVLVPCALRIHRHTFMCKYLRQFTVCPLSRGAAKERDDCVIMRNEYVIFAEYIIVNIGIVII